MKSRRIRQLYSPPSISMDACYLISSASLSIFCLSNPRPPLYFPQTWCFERITKQDVLERTCGNEKPKKHDTGGEKLHSSLVQGLRREETRA